MDLTVVADAVEVDGEALARVEQAVFAGEGKSRTVSVVIVDDVQSRQVNADHLGHDYETDVIAFDLGADDGVEEAGPDGEIYVNAELARREAADRGCEPFSELAFYVAHGLLHLLGYDDATDEQRSHMHSLQRRYLEAAGVTPPGPDPA